MMFSAGGSCCSFHFPIRGLALCADTRAAHAATNARRATIVPARCIRIVGSKRRKYTARPETRMRQIPLFLLLLLLLLLAVPSRALATWSVIAVDRSTGRVVIASATCVDGDDMFLPRIQAVVVPGKGVAACQAAVDNTHQNQMLVYQELQKGTDPKTIIEMLSADPAFQGRQFGIVDLQGRHAGHSGLT